MVHGKHETQQACGYQNHSQHFANAHVEHSGVQLGWLGHQTAGWENALAVKTHCYGYLQNHGAAQTAQ